MSRLHTPRYLILDIVKAMYVPFFVAICLIYVQASSLLHLNKSRLFVVHLQQMEFTVLRNISRALQFDLNAYRTESTLYLCHG
jgi:hypothetical protein